MKTYNLDTIQKVPLREVWPHEAHDFTKWLLEFDGTDEAFGLVEGYDDELGYFSIKEMAELNRQMGFAAVERDEHFSPKPLSAVRRR